MYCGNAEDSVGSAVKPTATVQGQARDQLAPPPSGVVPSRGGPDGVQFHASDETWRRTRQGAILTDGLGTIIEASDEAADLFHSSVNAMAGISFHDLLSGASRAAVDNLFAALRADQFRTLRTKIVRDDQSTFEAEISGTLLTFDDVRLYFVVSDVSNEEEERAEERTVLSEAPAAPSLHQEVRAEKSELLEAISEACHSIGQPATVIIGNLTLLGQIVSGGDAEASDILNECMRAAEKVADIIRDLRRVAS